MGQLIPPQDYIEQIMKEHNISEEEARELAEFYYNDDYTGDYRYEKDDRDYYSPSNPWNAPGMGISDFIK